VPAPKKPDFDKITVGTGVPAPTPKSPCSNQTKVKDSLASLPRLAAKARRFISPNPATKTLRPNLFTRGTCKKRLQQSSENIRKIGEKS
jgi:hypothetical protein